MERAGHKNAMIFSADGQRVMKQMEKNEIDEYEYLNHIDRKSIQTAPKQFEYLKTLKKRSYEQYAANK